MEIRCTHCGHVGEAAEVRALPGGVGLVCGACSGVNSLSLSEDKKPVVGRVVAGPTGSVANASNALVDWVGKHAVEHLIPVVGEGVRCPKCLTLAGGEVERVHCARCGLKLADAERFEAGRAPWELAPVGKGAEFSEAERLRSAFDGDHGVVEVGGRKEALDAWCAFVKEKDLIDYGIRRLQLMLIREPGDVQALEALGVLATRLQQRVLVATTEAQVSAEAYSSEISQLRHRLLAFSLVFWGILFVVFAVIFWGKG